MVPADRLLAATQQECAHGKALANHSSNKNGRPNTRCEVDRRRGELPNQAEDCRCNCVTGLCDSNDKGRRTRNIFLDEFDLRYEWWQRGSVTEARAKQERRRRRATAKHSCRMRV